MRIHKTAAIALAATMMLGSAVAFAESRDDDRQANAIASAGFSLSDAIAAVKGKRKGTPFEAGLEEEEGKLIYKIKLVDKDGNVSRVFFDPNSGKLLKTSPEGLIEQIKSVFDSDDKRQIDTVRTAKVDLGRAVILAEQSSGGRALDARIENENGKILYGIELARNGISEAVNVEPQSGKVTQVSDKNDREDGEHEGEHEEKD